MSTKGVRAYGIHSLEDLMARCDVNELTDCWNWTEATFADGTPRITATVAGVRSTFRGRRAALLLAGVVGAKNDRFAIPRYDCDNHRCVNPEHSRWASVKESWARLVKSGELKNLPVRVGQAERINAPRRKITPEIIEAIRTSDETCYELGARFGIAHTTAWKIKTYKTYAPKIASVFNWRP